MKLIAKLLTICCFYLSTATYSYAEIDWISFTLDNDLFVGNDNGYTNGIYIAAYDLGDVRSNNIPEYDFWVKPLLWSLPKAGVTEAAVNTYSFGQIMNTPSDITIPNPGANELPYSALLAMTNSYLTISRDSYADLVATTVGIVGPSALGEEAQKFVHKQIEADEPLGWDTQLGDEIVFQFTRARAWRHWTSQSNNIDLVTTTSGNLGTIRSDASVGAMVRLGQGLSSSYATTLFNSSRILNPSAINNGWYFYSGFQAGYTFNNIFADGNTFRDSRSIDYDPEFISILSGLAYSWNRFSITLAFNDLNVLQSGSNKENLKDLTQYGSISLGWKL